VTALLAVDNVSRRFGRLVAVNGVSMMVEPGELRAVIGPNGAGKTTFFNLISGAFPPTSGKLFFEGKEIGALPAHRRVALGIARTFQITEIFPELTVGENLRVALEVASGHRLTVFTRRRIERELEERLAALLALGGLGARADRIVGELSHGDQRSTEILMALALEPSLLLLDEPTAGMSDHETWAIAELVRRLHAEQRLTMVLIEHDMRVVFHLADRITVLAEGSVLADGTPREIARDDAVQAAYLGDPR
jgi:branched-chain amino acid transport system ATP-binding protein